MENNIDIPRSEPIEIPKRKTENIQEYMKNYKQLNKEKLNEKAREKHICELFGGKYTTSEYLKFKIYSNIIMHKNTRKQLYDLERKNNALQHEVDFLKDEINKLKRINGYLRETMNHKKNEEYKERKKEIINKIKDDNSFIFSTRIKKEDEYWDKFMDDEEIIIECIKQYDDSVMNIMSERLKDNENIAILAIENISFDILNNFSLRLRNNFEFIKKALVIEHKIKFE
eukprot:gene7983-12448_t